MAKWTFEPGHTAAAFRARHMMITYVRGSFKKVHGSLDFDPTNPNLSAVEAVIDTAGIWTGDHERDEHLRTADFLGAEEHPQITFKGDRVTLMGDHDYVVHGDLSIRGVTREVPLKVRYLGSWPTPWWEEVDGEWVNKGPKLRAGFVAEAEINRHDFGVSWNDKIDRGGVVVGDTVYITIDAEAVRDDD
jgi:polyisoprenoid-binding protein YceI